MQDGVRLDGIISKARQAEIRVAEAQGMRAQYDFITENMVIHLEPNDMLRRAKDNSFYRVSSIGERSPDVAESQFQLFNLELVSREAVSRGVGYA